MHGDESGLAVIGQVVTFLAATSLLVPAFRRIGLSAVMAFLVVGVMIGPAGLGRFAEDAPWIASFTFQDLGPAQKLAELGVVFLLFVIGLEVSLDRLWAMRRLVFGFGTSQLVLTAVVITAIAYAFGNPFNVSAVTGLAFALSSTAIVLQLLRERRSIAGPVGRAAFSVLLWQDLAVVPILFLVGGLSARASVDEPADLTTVLWSLLAAVLAIAAIVVVGRYLLRPLFRWTASVDSREVFVATVLLVIIGAAVAAEAAGLSMALGAFLAGLLLAETEFRHEVETDVEPFKGLLLGLFFVVVGMQIDLALVLAEPFRLFIGIVGLFIVKGAILLPLAHWFGMPWPRAIELSLLLGQAGEFAFVVVAVATEGAIYSRATSGYMMFVIAASIFLTPLVARLGEEIAARFEKTGGDRPDGLNEASGHVIVAGYGRVGQLIGGILQDEEIPHAALDNDADLVVALRKKGWPVHFGNAVRKDVLAAMGTARAAAIVVTMNDPELVERVVMVARSSWPHVKVYARARDIAQSRRLRIAGAAFAGPETIEATLQLGEALLAGLGMPDEAVTRVIHQWREVERAETLV
ncbi:MAG: monovalent cation:proton antiporter-2 (CPA2) family protein [Geminicoccaceae bacterium]